VPDKSYLYKLHLESEESECQTSYLYKLHPESEESQCQTKAICISCTSNQKNRSARQAICISAPRIRRIGKPDKLSVSCSPKRKNRNRRDIAAEDIDSCGKAETQSKAYLYLKVLSSEMDQAENRLFIELY
jgi:hypothetical protein